MTALRPTGFLSALVHDSRWRVGGAQPLPLAAADFGEPGASAEAMAPDVPLSPPVQPAALVRQTIARAPLRSETNPAPPAQVDGAETSSAVPSAPAAIVRRKPMAGANVPRAAVPPTTSVIAAGAETPRVVSRVEPSAIGADAAVGGGVPEIASATAAGVSPSAVHHEVRNLAVPSVPDRPAPLSGPSPSVPQRQENPVEGRRLLQTAAQPTATARLGSPAHRQSAEVAAMGAAAVPPEDSSQPGPRSFEAVVAQSLTNLLGRPVVVPAAVEPSRPAADLVVETTPAVYGAAAPAPAAAAVQPPVPTAARLLPSASDLALSGGAPRPISPTVETGPRVHIGTVEIVVAAPAEKRSPVAAGAKPSSNLASRRYLRSL